MPWLEQHLLAGPTGIFGEHPAPYIERHRHDAEAFANVLANAMQAAAATRAGRHGRLDALLDAGKVSRQSPDVPVGIAAAPLHRGPALRPVVVRLQSKVRRHRIAEVERHLIDRSIASAAPRSDRDPNVRVLMLSSMAFSLSSSTLMAMTILASSAGSCGS